MSERRYYCGGCEPVRRGKRKRKWSKLDLKWHIVDFLPSLDKPVQIEAFRASYNAWQNVCGLTFESVSNASDADLLILTRPIDGDGGTLAEHQMPAGRDRQLRGWYDIAEDWSVVPDLTGETVDLVTASSHETGHAIGLPHTKVPDSLMNPYLNPRLRGPQEHDIAAAVDLYGPPRKPVDPIEVELDYPVRMRMIVEMASGLEYQYIGPPSELRD